MANVQALIYQDARRQLMAGAFLLIMALIFLAGLMTFNIGSFLIAFFYFSIFAISGTGLLRAGYLDLQKAKQTELDFVEDDTMLTIEKVPSRMYMGQKPMKAFQAGLFDMDGELYSEVKEESHFKHRFLVMVTAIFAYDTFRSADFTLKDRSGTTVYRMEKKGGFKWRGYIQHKDGPYVAYTKDTKNKKEGQRITRYIETDQCRWRAEGDAFIGHFSIKGQDDRTWAVIKRGAIPREAADRFERMPGYLVEWKIRDQIPASLLAFLFLMQSRDR